MTLKNVWRHSKCTSKVHNYWGICSKQNEKTSKTIKFHQGKKTTLIRLHHDQPKIWNSPTSHGRKVYRQKVNRAKFLRKTFSSQVWLHIYWTLPVHCVKDHYGHKLPTSETDEKKKNLFMIHSNINEYYLSGKEHEY